MKGCWVSDSGEITYVEFGCHEEKAHDIIEKNGWYDEYQNWRVETTKYNGYGRDFLHEVKNYIRYMNWSNNPDWITNGFKNLTNAQAKIMVSY
jgi:hypothetical protein